MKSLTLVELVDNVRFGSLVALHCDISLMSAFGGKAVVPVHLSDMDYGLDVPFPGPASFKTD